MISVVRDARYTFSGIGACDPRPAFRTLRSAAVEPNISNESDHARTILDLVPAGTGVAILPANRRYRAHVIWRRMAPPPAKIQSCTVWRAADDSTPSSRSPAHRFGTLRTILTVLLTTRAFWNKK